MTVATNLIANERNRQIKEKGYDAAHDDAHKAGELVAAAAVYIAAATGTDNERAMIRNESNYRALIGWPWRELPKIGAGDTPKERLRCLVKAAALLSAEADRLQREIERASAAT